MRDLKHLHGPVLVGLRGSGKTTTGRALAGILGMDFTDSDEELEKRLGSGIASIFRDKGEEYFRVEESKVVKDLLSGPGRVVSTGGGAVLDSSVRELLKKRFTIWLHAPLDVLAARIKDTGRPSLTGKPAADELAEVLEAREMLYREVSCGCLNTARLGPDALAKKIAGIWTDLMAIGG
jgi:shikimate kinase